MAAFLVVNNIDLPCPSSYTWGLSDVSIGESGRDDSGLMHKNMIAQKRKLQVTWNALTTTECATILSTVNASEYLTVKYHDLMSNSTETRTFYISDRSAPYKCFWVGNKRVESLSFDFIER